MCNCVRLSPWCTVESWPPPLSSVYPLPTAYNPLFFPFILTVRPSYLVCNGEKQSRWSIVERVQSQALPQVPPWLFHPQNQTGTWCESPHSCKREEEDDTCLQQRIYQLTSTTCEPGNGNSHHCLHYRFAVLQLASSLFFFFFFYNYIDINCLWNITKLW